MYLGPCSLLEFGDTLKNKSEKFIQALAVANILLASDGLASQNSNHPHSNSIEGSQTFEDIQRDEIRNEHNAGCGNSGCGSNRGC